MPDFMPTNDSQLVNWLNAFLAVVNANLVALGLVAGDVTPISTAITAFSNSVTDQIAKRNAFDAAVAAKNLARAALMLLLRPFIRRINNHPGMTDTLRQSMGLPTPDRTPTRRGVGPEIPGVHLEIRPGQVVVHFGTNPDNEALNGKPFWALGVNIYRQLAGETAFSLIAMDTASPYVDHLAAGAVATYKLAYRGIRESDLGAESIAETVTVGG